MVCRSFRAIGSQLQQVILNLIINAVQAMSGVSEGPRALLISTARTEPTRLVAVRDSGRTGAGVLDTLQGLLHDQAERPGAGAVDLPIDRRSARRTIVGDREYAPRRSVSFPCCQPGQRIVIRRQTIGCFFICVR